MPVLPLVLVNGAEGIGTGWSTSIPNYNPAEIVSNLRRLLLGEEPVPMAPWYRGFTGDIAEVPAARNATGKSYAVTGTVAQVWPLLHMNLLSLRCLCGAADARRAVRAVGERGLHDYGAAAAQVDARLQGVPRGNGEA